MTPLELRVARLISPWTGCGPATVDAWARENAQMRLPHATPAGALTESFLRRHAEIMALVEDEVSRRTKGKGAKRAACD